MIDLRGQVPESWACIDCGVNTAPRLLNRGQMAQELAIIQVNQSAEITFDEFTEVYTVKPKIWQAAGMGPMDGCLCIGCLERRLGRMLTAKDFLRHHTFNKMPGTERLLSRRAVAFPTVAP